MAVDVCGRISAFVSVPLDGANRSLKEGGKQLNQSLTDRCCARRVYHALCAASSTFFMDELRSGTSLL
jgi:hypothetical protein